MTKCLIECLITYFYYLFLLPAPRSRIYSLLYFIDQSNTRVRSTHLLQLLLGAFWPPFGNKLLRLWVDNLVVLEYPLG